ncbi:ABC transporter permease [Desulfurobacterium sp.]
MKSGSSKDLTIKICAFLVVLWIFLLIILPHLGLLYSSFTTEDGIFTLSNYLKFFKQKIYYTTFIYTFLNGFFVSFISFLLAMPLAFFLVKVLPERISQIFMAILLIPLGVGELIVVYGWMIVLSDNGLIKHLLHYIGISHMPKLLNTPFSMIIGFLYVSFVFMLLPIMQALENLDDSMIEAALDLGVSKFTIFKEIVVPFSMSGIVSGVIMVFTLVIGDFLVPNILGGKSALWFTEIIYDNFLTTLNWNLGSAFGFLLLLGAVIVIWILIKVSGQDYERVIR